MDSDEEQRPRRSSVNARDERHYQKRIQLPDGGCYAAESVAAVPLSPGNSRPSRRDSDVSDSDYENDIGFSIAGGVNNPRDRSVYSTPLPANDPTDDDSEDEDADVTVQRFPTRTRLRTSDVEDPYPGDSLSSIAPTPYSLSGRYRDNVLRRSSSTATLSEEEFEIKYRRVEESPPPSWPITDNVAQTASTSTSYPTTHKSRSEDPPRHRPPHDDVKRPRSEMGMRQHISRANQASRFTVNENVADSEMHRYNCRAAMTLQTALEDGHRSARSVTPPRSPGNESKPSFPKRYRDPSWNLDRVSTKRSRDEGLDERSMPSSASSSSRSPDGYALGPPLFTTSSRRNYRDRHHDSPAVFKAVDDTHVPRVLRTFCDVPDLVFDGDKRESPGVCHKHDSTYRVASRATQTPSVEGTPTVSRTARSSHGTQRIRDPGIRESGQSVAQKTSNGGPPLLGRRASREGFCSLPSPERLPKEAPRAARTQSPRIVDRASPPMKQQRPLSPNVITCTPEESSSFTGKTDDVAMATVADSSDIEMMERIPSLPVVESSTEKAIQVSIAQPDKGLLACTVLSGILAAALVAAVIYALLTR